MEAEPTTPTDNQSVWTPIAEETCTLTEEIRAKRCRAYAMTWFSYDETIITFLMTMKASKYCFQEEECPSTGAKHLQGCFYFDDKIHIDKLDGLCEPVCLHKNGNPIPPRWRHARNWNACANYCSKEITRAGRRWFKGMTIRGEKPPLMIGTTKIIDAFETYTLKPWQQYIADIADTQCNIKCRKIYWIWGTKGNEGKTSFARHLCCKDPSRLYLCNAKSADMKSAIADLILEAELNPSTVILNNTRDDFDANKYCYGTIEEIKDAIFFSSKYKSKTHIFNTPHIFIFGNQPPKTKSLSLDRWILVSLDAMTVTTFNKDGTQNVIALQNANGSDNGHDNEHYHKSDNEHEVSPNISDTRRTQWQNLSAR